MAIEGQNLNKFIIGIIIVGITLVLGIYVAATMQTTLRAPNTAGSAINESVDFTTGLSQTLAASSLRDGACGTITQIWNGTSGGPGGINSGNYTQSGCTITNTTAVYTVAPWLITYPYSYTADTISSNASGSLVTSLNSGTAWITIIVVVGFAVIVLGMLTSGLGRTGSGNTYEQNEPIY